MKAFRNLLLVLPVLLSACIGTDILDDEIRPVVFEITQQDGVLSLLVGQEQTLTFEYVNEFGVPETVTPNWTTENSGVATISTDGRVTAVGPGQTNVFGTFEGQMSTPVLVSVGESENDVVKVLIEIPQVLIQVGEAITLTATAWNINNEIINDTEVIWEVDDSNLASIDENGVLTGIANGQVFVTATIDDVKSTQEMIEIGGTTKSATFEGRSGYKASGTATLSINEDGDVILELSTDFDTDFALGTFIYLSNSTSGSATRSAGLEVAEIKTDGGASFNISNLDPNVTLDDYRYVIVLCKPASITFGLADFTP